MTQTPATATAGARRADRSLRGLMGYFFKLGMSGFGGPIALVGYISPFVMVTATAVLYARYQGLSSVHAIFLGVGPAVVAIIAIAATKLARSTNKSDPCCG